MDRWAGGRRLGTALVGLLLGVALLALTFFFYTQAAREANLRQLFQQELDLPPEAFELTRVARGRIRIAVRDLLVADEAGDTVIAAPRAAFWIDAGLLDGEGPMVLSQVDLRDPYVRLVQFPDGTWNYERALRVTVADEPITDPADDRPIVLTDVRVSGGRALIATPWEPGDTVAPPADVRLTRLAGIDYRLQGAHGIDGRLATARIGGPEGWLVDVSALSGMLTDPEVRVAQFAGTLRELPDGLGFAVRELRTDRSRVAGTGSIRTVAEETFFDLELLAEPLDFADLRWLLPQLPPEGTATFGLAATTAPGGRTTWALSDVEALALDSRVLGRITLLTGGDQPLAFRDTDLLLDPLDLRVVDALGLADRVPYAGEVRGRVATIGVVEELEGPLTVDLVATVVPRGLPELPVSTIAAQGQVAVGAVEDVRFDGLQVSLRPLQLAALRPLLPEQEELLRGTLVGNLVLSGSPTAVEISDGTLAYDVEAAPTTRLAGVTGLVELEPELRYDVSAVAEPLALGTLAELVPAFPFEHTLLGGPVAVAGTADAAAFTLNLRGEVGGFFATGEVLFAEPARFRVAGRLDALRPLQLVRQEIPLAGPVSGPFLVEGTTQDLRFEVDFIQAAGSLELAGRVQLLDGVPPLVAVQGELEDFQIGTLIGRSGLFLSPLSGPIRVDGGGGTPFDFMLGLRGPFAAFDVRGWYDPRDVPVYAASGTVAGLDLRQVPGLESLPTTNLVSTVVIEGRGLTLETAEGRFAADMTGSRVGPLPLDAGAVQGMVEGGILRLDALQVALAGTRLEAEGSWGITRPAPAPLGFSLVSPSLAALTPIVRATGLIEPQLGGSVALEGTVGGTIENPIVDVTGSGRNLRFDSWRAASLSIMVDADRRADGWWGEAAIETTDAVVPDLDRFQLARVEVVGSPGSVAVGALIRRDRLTDAAFSGVLELAGRRPTGISLQSFSLRLDETFWRLARPSTLAWGDLTSIAIDGLELRQTGAAEGLIAAHGSLPPTGDQDFRLQIANLDVGQLRRLVPNAIEVDGVVTLEATVTGPAETPTIDLNGHVTAFQFRGATAEAISIAARYEGTTTVTDVGVWQDQVQVATAQGTIPMVVSMDNLIPQFEFIDAGEISVAIRADSIPIGLVTAAIPQLEAGAGILAGEVTIVGTFGSPQLGGWVTLRDGAVTIPELAVRYREITGDLEFEGQSILVRSLTARSVGDAAVSGRIEVDDLRRPDFDLNISLDQFRGIQRRDVAAVSVTGEAALTGRYPTPTLTGRVVLSDGTIAMPPLGDEQAFQVGELDFIAPIDQPIPVTVLEPTLVDLIRISQVEVAFGDAVWVESPEMRIQLGGELLVSRFAPEDWQIFGDLIAVRGTYTLIIGPIVREFDVVSGRLEFFGTPDLNPSMDVLAQHRIRATGPGATGVLAVQVQITGSAQFPRLTLTTDTQPPLPESEILSYLIFGRPSFALGQVGEGLARQILLQEAVGGLLAGQIEQLIRQAGLPFDYIRVRGRPAPTEFAIDPLGSTTIEVGWQVVPDVFWTVEWGVAALFGGTAGDTWGTSLEWQIDPQWSTRLAWEPLRRDPLLQRTLTEELLRQFTMQLRRRWEYGLTPPPPAVLQDLPAELTDVEVPEPIPTPTARPPPTTP